MIVTYYLRILGATCFCFVMWFLCWCYGFLCRHFNLWAVDFFCYWVLFMLCAYHGFAGIGYFDLLSSDLYA